jgi:glycosyltransferase involved in cell wall biosynthesis
MQTEKKHIVVITGQHMTANPRVWKEANSLADKNYKVTILTTWYDKEKLDSDKKLLNGNINYKAAVNLIKGEGVFNDRVLARVKRKLALVIKRVFKIDSTHLIVYNLSKQVKAAINENADLYIAHQETGLLIGCALIKKGKKVAFDIEDWYSRDYINNMRPVKLLQGAEKVAIEQGVYISCPSFTMADALMKTYQSSTAPSVIYNSFSVSENKLIEAGNKKANSLVWFSQVVGPGRGLETLFKALQLVKTPVELHLIGNMVNGYKEKLMEQLNQSPHKTIFHDSVHHKLLLPLIAKYNIGLALENNYPDNKDTTISNKILQNIQAGNIVLATNTKGQAEVAELFPDTVVLVEVNDHVKWATAIESLLNRPVQNADSLMKRFKEILSWEVQEKKLLELVQNALEKEA